MKAKDIMEKYVATVSEDTSIKELLAFFVRHGVLVIPVVGEDEILEGIVSEADLIYKKIIPPSPKFFNILGASIYYSGVRDYDHYFKTMMATKAKDVMTKDVVTVSPDEDVNEIVTLMVEKHLKYVPVVENKRVVGLITRKNILELLLTEEN